MSDPIFDTLKNHLASRKQLNFGRGHHMLIVQMGFEILPFRKQARAPIDRAGNALGWHDGNDESLDAVAGRLYTH